MVREEAGLGVADDLEAGNSLNAGEQTAGCVHCSPGELKVALFSVGLEGGPSRRVGATWPSSQQGRGSENATRPVFVDEHLVLEVIQVPVQDAGCALGGEAVLVDVRGNGGYPRHAKIPGRQDNAELLKEGKQVSTNARIHMQGNAPFLRYATQTLYRVDDAVRVLGRRPKDHDRVPVHQFLDGLKVNSQVLGQRGASDLDTEVLAALFPGHVCRLGDDHLRLAYASGIATVTVGLYRQQAAFRTAGGHDAADLVVAVQEVAGRAQNLSLETLQALEGRRIQAIGGEVLAISFLEKPVVVVVQVIDEAPRLGFLILRIVLAEGFEVGEDLGAGSSL